MNTEINRETLAFWRNEAAIGIEGLTPFALDVDQKVDNNETLSEIEQKVLDLGLTREHVEFVKEHLWSL